jgi:hypothetical protein
MDSTPEATVPKERSSDNGGAHHARTSPSGPIKPMLTEEMLARFASRAASYDRENRFFEEDFDELRSARYLLMPVPTQFGGSGMTLAEVCREQRRLAYYAPATALAVNMHLYWIGVAADLWRQGDVSLEWILREAAGGEIFAAGHAESGNDVPVLLSTSKAERVDGGYRFTGRKHFGSLTPVWTRFGMHGMDTSDPAQPKIVHAFMPRDAEGYTIKETWDVLGMRATRSDDTVLENVFVPDRYIARVVPAGGAGIDRFVLAVFAWALMGWECLLRTSQACSGTERQLSKEQRLTSALPFDGVSPGDTALHCRNGYRTRFHRTTSGDDRRRLVQWRRSRCPVAFKNLCGQIPRGGGFLARRGSGFGCDRGRRDLSFGGLRAIDPRCATRPDSSRQFLSHA